MRDKAHSMNSSVLYRVVAVLLVAAVGTSMLATAPLAKYVTKTTVSDSARVAKFSVSATGESSPSYTLDADNNSATYDFTVTSQSEVETTYDIIVTLENAFSGVTLSLDGVDGRSADGLTYKFAGVGTFAAGSSQTKSHTLKFTMNDDASTATYPNITVQAVVSQTR